MTKITVRARKRKPGAPGIKLIFILRLIVPLAPGIKLIFILRLIVLLAWLSMRLYYTN